MHNGPRPDIFLCLIRIKEERRAARDAPFQSDLKNREMRRLPLTFEIPLLKPWQFGNVGFLCLRLSLNVNDQPPPYL